MSPLLLWALLSAAPGSKCVPASATFGAQTMTAAGPVLCFSDDSCLQLDVRAKTFTFVDAGAASAGAEPPEPLATLTYQVHVCDPDRSKCRDVMVPSPGGPEAPGTVVVSADRRFVAVVRDQVSLFEHGRLVKTIYPWKTAMGTSLRGARFLGETLLVATSASPVSSFGRLYEARTGRLLASVGGDHMNLDDVSAVELGPNVWGFPSFDGEGLFVHDVSSGKKLPPIRLSLHGARTTPGTVWAQGTFDHTAIVATTDQVSDGVTVISVPTRKIEHLEVPRCR